MTDSDDRTTELRRVLAIAGNTHAIEVRTGAVSAQIEFSISDPDDHRLGSISGEVPNESLQAAADLLGTALTAAAQAHAGEGFAPRMRQMRLREKHPNHGSRWSETEDERLAARFRNSASIPELTNEFGRNENSIRARLVMLDLLPTDKWPPGARMPPEVLRRHQPASPQLKLAPQPSPKPSPKSKRNKESK